MERIDGPLPMSGLYMVDVPAEDCERELSIMRAAVKFTFNITNKSSRSIEITKLTIDKMAEREYYLPHNATYIERETTEGTKFWDINSFDVPTLKGYYTYDASSLFKGQLLPEMKIRKPMSNRFTCWRGSIVMTTIRKILIC